MKRTAGVLLAALAVGCSPTDRADKPVANYDQKTGKLTRLAFDANKNGKNDSVSYMDGTRILRVELDLDENGKTERWDFYRLDGTLDKVGLASKNDGVMDSVAYYDASGAVARIEVSTHRNGVFDKTEFYEGGALVRSQEDTNGDGRPDKWDTYRAVTHAPPGAPPYVITSTAFDDSGRGKPQRRFVYGRNGTVDRVEIDPEGDGLFVPPAGSTPTPATPSRARR